MAETKPAVLHRPHMREFSMFFQMVLSILGVIAIIMMNMIVNRMDTYSLQQQELTISVTRFMAKTDNDIVALKKNQNLFDKIQRNRTTTVDRAERYFDSLENKRHYKGEGG